AHSSFKWRNNAAHNAGVTCVIVGMGVNSEQTKTLYTNDEAEVVPTINGYLLPGPHISVQKQSKPISSLPPMDYGSKPADGGNLILSVNEMNALLDAFP